MTISDQLKSIFKRKIRKNYVAELLGISRPTLNSKLAKDDFTKEEIKKLIENDVIEVSKESFLRIF